MKRLLRARIALSESHYFILEQGSSSAGTFGAAFLLARTLPAREFGLFALLYGIIILGLTTNNWLLRPALISIRGAYCQDTRSRSTIGLSLLAVGLGVIVAVSLVGAAVLLDADNVAPALCCAAIGTQIFETLRRCSLARGSYGRAIAASVTTYQGYTCSLLMLWSFDQLAVSNVFWALFLSSLAGVAVHMQGLLGHMGKLPDLRELARQCRVEGGLVAACGLFVSCTQYGMVWATAGLRGPAESAVLSAMNTVLGFSNPVMNSSAWLLLMTATRSLAERGQVSTRELTRPLLSSVVPLVGYWLALLILPHVALTLVFGADSPYAQASGALQLTTLFFATGYIAMCAELLVDAAGKTRERLRVEASSALLFTLAVVPATYLAGFTGTMMTGIATQCVRAARLHRLARPVWQRRSALERTVRTEALTASSLRAGIQH
jgi:O-antigen/teichoic acid export membrane protein